MPWPDVGAREVFIALHEHALERLIGMTAHRDTGYGGGSRRRGTRMRPLLVFRSFIVVLTLGVASWGLQGGARALAHVHVDDDGLCEGDSPCYRTIQEGVGAVASGGIIDVHEGTYPEKVRIDKPFIQLVGRSRDSVVLTGTTYGSPRLELVADGILVETMTIRGGFFGIRAYGKFATVAGVAFVDVHQGVSAERSVLGLVVRDSLFRNASHGIRVSRGSA